MQPFVRSDVALDDVARLLIHDLKNKLSLIATNAHFISGAPVPDDVREAAADIELSANLVDKIIANFCAVAFDPQRAQAGPLVDVPVAAALAKLAGERVRTLPVMPSLRVRADDALLQRALAVLVDNGVHHARVGSEVDVSARFRDGRVYLKVADDGAAIPAELVPLVLEPAARFHDAAVRMRLGPIFGLAFSRAAVESMGGKLSVEQREKGAAFVIELAGSE
jgi:signal transduction histidine kinase